MVALPRTQEQADPIAQVKATVRIEDYAINKMGWVPKRRTPREDWFSCPWHQDSTPSLHIRFAEAT
jgi:DNA primase